MKNVIILLFFILLFNRTYTEYNMESCMKNTTFRTCPTFMI
jgi:hypothetical protein